MYKLERWERFTDARVEFNIHGKQTMDEVEAATGVSKNMISDLENENKNRDVGYQKIAKLANHYGVSIDWLVGSTTDIEVGPGSLEDIGISEESKYLIMRKLKDNYELKSFANFINDMIEFGISPEIRSLYDALILSAKKSVYFGDFCNFSQPQIASQKALDALGYQTLSPMQAINYYSHEIAEFIKHALIAKYINHVPIDKISAHLEITQALEKLDLETIQKFHEYITEYKA